MSASVLPKAIDELEAETHDAVLDHVGAPPPAVPKRRGPPAADHVGRSIGPDGTWVVFAKGKPTPAGATRWWVRHACGRELLMQVTDFRRIGRRCRGCYAPTPPKQEPWHPPLQVTREMRRSSRKREVRGRTINTKRMTKQSLQLGAALYPEDTRKLRPVVRAECEDGYRPCPFVSCVFHLYLDVSPGTGAIKLNFPDLEPDELEHSCCLDVADKGGCNLEDVGAMLNVTRERIRQIETRALARLELVGARMPIREYFPEPGDGRRRLPTLETSR